MIYLRKNSKKGFTIVELMIALVIMALLMTSLALAFKAASDNWSVNEKLFNILNTGRQALLRITTDIRTAQAVAVIGAGGDPDNKQCSLVTSDGRDITYLYNEVAGGGLEANTLYYVRNSDSTNFVLCDNVTDMTFDRTLVNDDPNSPGYGAVKNVQISMTVSSGLLSKTISTAAVVRRNIP